DIGEYSVPRPQMPTGFYLLSGNSGCKFHKTVFLLLLSLLVSSVQAFQLSARLRYTAEKDFLTHYAPPFRVCSKRYFLPLLPTDLCPTHIGNKNLLDFADNSSKLLAKNLFR